MLAALARPRVNASVTWREWDPLDPRWYQTIGSGRSDAGINVLPEDAVKIATVYRAINVRAHSIASIPLVVNRRLGDDEGKERAREHPAYNVLHDRPNAFQTSFRWRHLATVQKILWGNHYSEIVPTSTAFDLKPLDPRVTRVVDQLADGRLLYVTKDVLTRGGYGPERRLVQDELVHLRGFSLDGKSGIPLPNLAKNAMGLALVAEKHGSMFLKRGAQFSGILTSDGSMTQPQREENEDAWTKARGGTTGTGTTPVLANGLKFQQIQSNNKDSQWLEARTFQVEELLRYIGVPGVLCGYSDKTSTYASAEQFFLSFVTHTVRPEAVEFEDELNASVITESPEYFASFVLDGLLRGDIQTRYAAYQIGIQSGFLNRNEVRGKEDMNAAGPELDKFLEPLNMVEAGKRPAPTQGPRPAQAPADNAADATDDEQARRIALLTQRSVERLVRKEIGAIAGMPGKLGAAKRFAGNAAGWRAWLAQFYTDHGQLLVADLGLTTAQSASYCGAQRQRFEAGIPVEHADLEAESVGTITALLEST